MSEPNQTPGPGVYPGTGMATYHGWKAASSSALSRLMRSPAHLRAYLEEPHRETPALRLGRAIHSAVLEPDDFAARYVTAGQCEAVTGKGARCSNPGVWMHKQIGWVCGVHAKGHEDGAIEQPKAELLTLEDMTTCLRVRDSVNACGTARGLITGPGDVELSMIWEDRESGATCKGRWDRFSPDIAGGAVIDLKTTVSALRRDFERAIFSFNYHGQGALYLMGARARKLPARHYCIIALEKDPPYAVAVYRLTEGAISAGEDQVRPLLRLYARLQEIPREEWPGYPDEVTDVSLPDWAWRVTDERVRELGEVAA